MRLVLPLFAVLAATLALLCPHAQATSPTVFTTLLQPYGITVAANGNVFVSSDADNLSETWVTKFSPTGVFLGRARFGTPTVGDLGKLATDPATGKIWDIASNGILRTIDPNTMTVQVEKDLTTLDVTQSATNIYDVNLEWFKNESGSILPWYASYGDIALHRSGAGGNRLDAFITARTVPYNIAWVIRLTWHSGQFQGAKAVVTSTAVHWVGTPRGIAVTPTGTVLTTLPRVGRLYGDFTDQVVSFPFDFPESGGEPTVELDGWDESSRGMTTDSRGYTYLTSQINSSLCGKNAGGAIMLLSPLREFQACYPHTLLGKGEDVAVRPSDFRVYSTIADAVDVIPTYHEVLDWGKLAGTSLTVRKSTGGSGTVTSTPGGIACGSTCSSSYGAGDQVTLHANPATGSAFDGWSGGGCSGTGDCTVTINGDTTVTATFHRVSEQLTVFRQGTGTGTVFSVPFGIDCPPTCSAGFLHLDGVTLVALPGSGSTFSGWSSSDPTCTGQNQCDLTMDSDTSVSATFWPQGAPIGYPRPKAASPLRVSLVPAYRQCTSVSADTRHRAPLAHPSCRPPTQASSELTIGSPDANGPVANSVGSARYAVLPGIASTPLDEADVRVTFKMQDVRRKGSLSDYTGQLRLSQSLRITDRLNSWFNEPLIEPGTVEASLGLPIACVATADTSIGSQCALTTTLDTMVPGIVLEGNRSVWELGRITVFDGGADGLAGTGPNTVFATQGVFVP